MISAPAEAQNAVLVEAVATKRTDWRVVIDALLLAFSLAIVTAISIRPSAAFEGDLWWHLRTGTWILQHGAVPWRDSLAWTTNGQPWIAYTWLFDLLCLKLYAFAGLHGILTMTIVLRLAGMGALIVLLTRYAGLLRAIGLAQPVLIATAPLTTPRPWLFSIFFFTIELYLLMRSRDRRQALWLLPIPLLMALWANIHIQFVYGLLLLGLFAGEGPLVHVFKLTPEARLSSKWFWAALAASAGATLINPYGWHIYSVVNGYATQNVALAVVDEMQAMSFRSFTDWTALTLVCAAWFVLGKSNKKQALFSSLLVAGCWFGFHTGRDVWWVAIVASMILAYWLRIPASGPARTRIVQWLIAAPITIALTVSALSSPTVSDDSLRKEVAETFPEKACSYLQKYKPPGPLFTDYNWGGYVTWRVPEMPVSMDGRANVHGDTRLARVVNTLLAKSGWEKDPDLQKANTILLRRDEPLASVLSVDPRFRVIYQDEIAAIFQPASRRGSVTR